MVGLRLHPDATAPSSSYPTGCPQWVFDLSATPVCTACYELPWPLCYDPEGPERLLPRSTRQATRRSLYLRPCGPFGLLHPKCEFPPTNLGLAGFDRAAFDLRRAGLGHFDLASDTSLRFRQGPFSEGWLTKPDGNPGRSACPVVSIPFPVPKSHTPSPFACLLLGSSFDFAPWRLPTPYRVAVGRAPRPCLPARTAGLPFASPLGARLDLAFRAPSRNVLLEPPSVCAWANPCSRLRCSLPDPAPSWLGPGKPDPSFPTERHAGLAWANRSCDRRGKVGAFSLWVHRCTCSCQATARRTSRPFGANPRRARKNSQTHVSCQPLFLTQFREPAFT